MRFVQGVNRLNIWLAGLGKWFAVGIVTVVTFDVVMRYVFNSPTIWGYDLTYMFGGCLYVFGLGYVEKVRGNVRVDLIYGSFSEKTKLWIDTVATAVIILPSYLLLTGSFWNDAYYAFKTKEMAITSTWYPLLWPIKSVIAFGFSMMILQIFSNMVEDIRKLSALSRKAQ